MRRSEINQIIIESIDFIESFGFFLPPFAYNKIGKMILEKESYTNIINCKLGWDITDYGKKSFRDIGLCLFTIRNGNLIKSDNNIIPYAEKIMISRKNQISPMHRHIVKTEDIINRGGASLAIEMFNSNPRGNLDFNKQVSLLINSQHHFLKPGEIIKIDPGESVTLFPGNWHKFWGDGGDVLIGEVSSINDDNNDNIFYEKILRFSEVEEDEDPIHLLVSDYKKYII